MSLWRLMLFLLTTRTYIFPILCSRVNTTGKPCNRVDRETELTSGNRDGV